MKKKRKRKPRYSKRSGGGKSVAVETPADMRKEFPKDLIDAYIKVKETDFEDDKIYKAFKKLADDFLGNKKDDPIEDGRLIVRLTRATMDIKIIKRCKEHPKYKAIRKPRADCKACWDMYNEKAKAKEAKKTKEKATEET